MIRAVGFALAAFAAVGAVVLVTNAREYEPGAPLSYNLRNAVAVDRYIVIREREMGLSEPLEECEAPEGWVVWNWLEYPGTPEPERDRQGA